jgi:hypothetical protein
VGWDRNGDRKMERRPQKQYKKLVSAAPKKRIGAVHEKTTKGQQVHYMQGVSILPTARYIKKCHTYNSTQNNVFQNWLGQGT